MRNVREEDPGSRRSGRVVAADLTLLGSVAEQVVRSAPCDVLGAKTSTAQEASTA